MGPEASQRGGGTDGRSGDGSLTFKSRMTRIPPLDSPNVSTRFGQVSNNLRIHEMTGPTNSASTRNAMSGQLRRATTNGGEVRAPPSDGT